MVEISLASCSPSEAEIAIWNSLLLKFSSFRIGTLYLMKLTCACVLAAISNRSVSVYSVLSRLKTKMETDSDRKTPASKKRTQCYRTAYTEKYAFIKPTTSDPSRVFCETCKSEFGIRYGGIDDVRRHVEGARHESKAKALESSKKSKPIKSYFATQNVVSNLDLDVTKAEVTMVDLCVELNLPMSSLDKFTKTFKKIFHDSKIAKNFILS